VIEAFSLGTAAGATLSIRYEGAHEAVNTTPQAPVFDPATIKSTATGGGPITRREHLRADRIRLRPVRRQPLLPVTASHRARGGSPFHTITIAYDAAINCP
jgi:hypothetical protein